MNGNEWEPPHYDESGTAWGVDSNDRKRVPEHAEKISKPGEFTEYMTPAGAIVVSVVACTVEEGVSNE